MKNPQIVIGDTESFPYIHQKQEVPPAIVISRPLSKEISRWLVTHPMKDVIEHGTGTAARLPDYHVFGKTGTAQKWDPQAKRYSDTAFVCSIVCGAPVENPQVLVLVMIDNPRNVDNPSGGTIAGPIVKRLLEKSLFQLGIPGQTR